MIDGIPTPQAIARAGAIDLRRYLTASGWRRTVATDRYVVWSETQTDRRLQIVLPEPDAEDFAQRVIEALQVLAHAERRTVSEVLADAEAGGADVVSVRINTNAPSGLAPLDVADRAVGALKNLVVGSAAGVEIAGAILPPHRPRAERYAGRARLATGSGSFVLTVAMPLYEGRTEADVAPGQAAMDEVVEVQAVPFGRQVANRMREVSLAATQLAQEIEGGRDDITAFDTDPGVTGNATELESLAHLGGGLASTYSIRFSASPVIGPHSEPAVVPVGPREQQVLGQAAQLLRELKPKDDVAIAGTIVRMARDADHGPGEAVIKGVEMGPGRVHRYRVQLSEEQFREAIAAFDRGLPVFARGNLVVRGNFLTLDALTSFSVQMDLPLTPR